MLVTELLEGGSLHDRLGEPELRWYRGGARVALDVARALAFLHRQSIAHLDVKPAVGTAQQRVLRVFPLRLFHSRSLR